MVKKFIHSITFILFSITCNSQKEVVKDYYDLNIYQFSGQQELAAADHVTNKRYIAISSNDGTIQKIKVHDPVEKSYTIDVSNENGVRILKFPTRKSRRYEGNWFIFKNNKKSKAEWQISNDTLIVINASKQKSQGASVAVIKLNRNDSLIIKSYSICCLDIDAEKSNTVTKRQYLLNRISTDASITWHTYNLNLEKNILYSHRTNSTLSEDGTSDGKSLSDYFSRAGGSLFWLLINYW